MRLLIRILVALLGLLSITACATFNASSSYSPSATSNRGLAVFSFTTNDRIQNYFLQYRSVGPEPRQAGDVTLYTYKQPTDWTSPNRGRLVAVELPVGDYEIYRWTDPLTAEPIEDFSIRFSVRPGRVTYFGNVHVTIGQATARKGKFTLDVRDQSQRDLSLLIERYPSVKPTDIDTEISKVN